MKKVIFLLLLAIVYSSQLYSQSTTAAESDALALEAFTTGEYEKALGFMQKSLAVDKDAGDSLLGYRNNFIGAVAQAIGNFNLAETHYQKSLEYYTKALGKGHLQSGKVRINLGRLYSAIGQYEKSISYFNEGLLIVEKSSGISDGNYIKGIASLANLYDDLSRFAEAERLMMQVIATWQKEKLEKDAAYASIIGNLASLYRKLNRFEEAEPLLLQSIEIEKQLLGNTHPEYAGSLVNLGNFYVEIEKLAEAEKNYLEAISLIDANDVVYAQVSNDLAELYNKQNKIQLAEDFYGKSLAVWKKIFGEEHLGYAVTSCNLANLKTAQKRYNEAEKDYLKAIELLSKTVAPQHEEYIKSLLLLANLYFKTGENESCGQYILKSFSANTSKNPSSLDEMIGSIPTSTPVSKSLMLETLDLTYQLLKIKNPVAPQIQQLMEAALKLAQEIRNSFIGEQDKLNTLLQTKKWMLHAIESSFLKKDDSQHHNEKAFSFAELNKSVLLQHSLQANQAYVFGDIPDSLANKEKELYQQISEIKAFLASTKVPDEKLAAEAALGAANLSLNELKKNLEKNYPKYNQIKYAEKRILVDDIQKKLTKGTLFIEYVVSDSAIYIFSIDNKSFSTTKILITEQELNQKTKNLRQALSDYEFIATKEQEAYKLFCSSASWFYKELLNPVLKSKKDIENLIIVPDAALGHVPFEVLLTESPSSEINYAKLPYLLNKYSVSYNYSALIWIENKLAKKNGSGKMLAAAASYTKTAKSLRTGNYFRNLRDVLQDLPAARQEVEALSNIFKGEFLLAGQSSEKQFKAKVQNYSIVHLAMHGLLNAQNPMLSSLAFTDDGDSLDDNFLQAWEISHLKLNAELVVLSACETGYGKFQQGEGVMSLARSFMYAGVPSLVVSLWQVNDASTSVIMQLFYKNISKGMDKAAALRQAKLDYIKSANNPNATHPAFWAAFIQLGDSKPIHILAKNNNTVYWLLAAGGIFTFLAFVVLKWIQKRKATR